MKAEKGKWFRFSEREEMNITMPEIVVSLILGAPLTAVWLKLKRAWLGLSETDNSDFGKK